MYTLFYAHVYSYNVHEECERNVLKLLHQCSTAQQSAGKNTKCTAINIETVKQLFLSEESLQMRLWCVVQYIRFRMIDRKRKQMETKRAPQKYSKRRMTIRLLRDC